MPLVPGTAISDGDAADAVHAINQRIFETSLDLILVTDRKGTFVRVSPSSQAILGFDPAEMVGRSAVEFLYHDDLENTRNEMRLARRNLVMRNFECRYVHKEKRNVTLWWSGVYSPTEEQHFFIGRDVTDRKEAERRLREVQAELAHVSRLTEMGQMASGLAHELNQPLSAASSYLGALLVLIDRTDEASRKRTKDTVEKAIGQVQRAGAIIRNLRGFVRKTAPERAAEALAPLIEEAIMLAFMGARDRGLTLHRRFAENVRAVLVDKVQIQQVLVNLLRNAAEAIGTSERREIVIEAARGDGDIATIAVVDSGPGIAPDIAARLFEPFVTTKEHGMGVGLSLCRTIIEAHGGRLWAEPNSDGGTIFRFTVPLAPPQRAP